MISQRDLQPRLSTDHYHAVFFFADLREISLVFCQFKLWLIIQSPAVMVDVYFYDIFHTRRIRDLQIWSSKCHTPVLHHIRSCQYAYFMICRLHLIRLCHITHIVPFFIHPKSIRYFHLIIS